MKFYPLKKILIKSLNKIFSHNLYTYTQTPVFISVNKKQLKQNNLNMVNNPIFINNQKVNYTHNKINFNKLVERTISEILYLSSYTHSLLLKLLFLYKKRGNK